MTLILVAAPAALISLDEGKAHLDVGHDDDDALITAQTAAATAWAEQFTGAALMPQTWDYSLDQFPWGYPGVVAPSPFIPNLYPPSSQPAIRLPMRPVTDVVSVKYYDSDGVQQTWAADQYAVYGLAATAGTSVLAGPNMPYPAIQYRPDAVTVRFTAGYAADHPHLAMARAAVLLGLGDLYANRDGQVIDARAARVENATALNLLAPLRGELV